MNGEAMATTWTCANGHEVASENEFCGTCGAKRVPPFSRPPPLPSPSSKDQVRGGRWSARFTSADTPRKRLIGVVAIAAIVGGVVAGIFLLMSDDEDDDGAEGETLVVEVGEMGHCDEYSQSYVVGARLTLANASGEIVATDTTSGSGEEIVEFCVWEVELVGIERSGAYELTIQLPQGQYDSVPPAPQTFTYSYEELEEKDWRVTFTQNH